MSGDHGGLLRNGELEVQKGFAEAVAIMGSLLEKSGEAVGPSDLEDVVDVAVKCGGSVEVGRKVCKVELLE